MAVRIKFDKTHNVISPTFVLATRSGKKLGVIPAEHISMADAFNSRFDLEFQVCKTYDGKPVTLWNDIVDFKLVWCKEWDVWFEIYVSTTDDDDTIKSVTCVSLGEAELSQVMLYNIEINTEDDIARDDYEVTVLYDTVHPKGSLLHRIMEKCPHYKVKYVAPSIAPMQRTFSFNDTSVYDAMQAIAEELDCIFVISSGTADDGSISRSVSVYDLESYCVACGNRGHFTKNCDKCGDDNILPGYGEDTMVFVSTENLADDINVKVNTSAVKNCFRLTAGDDLMTATVRNCNPNGSQYIWFMSDEMKNDMSRELVQKLAEYDERYDYYNNDYVLELNPDSVEAYNALVAKYKPLWEDVATVRQTIQGFPALMSSYFDTIDFYIMLKDGLMPKTGLKETTAAEQAMKLTSTSLSPVAVQSINYMSEATASSTVLSMAKILVDKRYQVKARDGILQGNVWTGRFAITSYANDEDTAVTDEVHVTINEDYEKFIKQKVDKVLKSEEDKNEVAGISALFALPIDDFKEEIKKYCLSSLTMFADCCQSCLDILIENGVADKQNDVYNEIYVPFYTKMSALNEESKLRENELAIIYGKRGSNGERESIGMQDIFDDESMKIQNALDMENFLGDYWLEFISYRREDTYSNDNFISDGLNNAEMFANALEFVETARKEIYKSATRQHQLTATLKNLLVMKEFEPLIDMFEVGNWIRVKIDDSIYRLRLLRYQIDFDDLSNISVEFSDVQKFSDGMSDSQSIMKQAASMASSYNAVSRQASKGKKGNEQIDNWVNKGLALTKLKIVDNADNQNITWDNHGLLCRENIEELDRYSDKQLKIINRGLYLTDDGWISSKAGIGDFTFWNPMTRQIEEDYGVIAKTLVGNLILSENVGVYNRESTVILDKDGIYVGTAQNLCIEAELDDEGENRGVNGFFIYDHMDDLSVGDTISIGSELYGRDIAANRAITSIEKHTSDHGYAMVVFDGSPVPSVDGIVYVVKEGVSININPNGADGVFVVNSAANGKVMWVDKNGNAYFNGDISGATGTFHSAINVGNGAFVVDSDGNLTATKGSFKGDISGATGTFQGSINVGNGAFIVDSEGNLTATKGSFKGDITGASGTFSGDITGATGTFGGQLNVANKFVVDSSGNVTMGGSIALSGSISWNASNSPVQCQYSADGSSWHTSMLSTDYYARYSYDGGTTWTGAVNIKGVKGDKGDPGDSGAPGSYYAPDYLKSTYIDMFQVNSPFIVGGKFYATGLGASDGAAFYIYDGGTGVDRYGNVKNGNQIGFISYDTSGAGSSNEARYRVLFTTQNNTALKINSAGNMSISAASLIYVDTYLKAAGGIGLESNSYGSTLPSTGTNGKLFFLTA